MQDIDALRDIARRFADPVDYCYDEDGGEYGNPGVHVEYSEAVRLAEVIDRAARAMEATS